MYHAQDNKLPAQSQTGRGFVFLRLGDLLLQLFVVAVRPETENAMFESCLAPPCETRTYRPSVKSASSKVPILQSR